MNVSLINAKSGIIIALVIPLTLYINYTTHILKCFKNLIFLCLVLFVYLILSILSQRGNIVSQYVLFCVFVSSKKQ